MLLTSVNETRNSGIQSSPHSYTAPSRTSASRSVHYCCCRRLASSTAIRNSTGHLPHIAKALCAKTPDKPLDTDASLDGLVQKCDDGFLPFVIREAKNTSEYEDVGWLRATAYYEAHPPGGRFQDNYIRQFAQTEARSLSQRTQPPGNEQVPETVCLVAAIPSSAGDGMHTADHIAGTLDIRPPAKVNGLHPEGVPHLSSESEEADTDGVYLLNVAVDPEWRGQGCGKIMMRAAERLIQERWSAKRIYAHVAKANEAALSLYLSFGYKEFGPSSEGQNILLYKAIK